MLNRLREMISMPPTAYWLLSLSGRIQSRRSLEAKPFIIHCHMANMLLASNRNRSLPAHFSSAPARKEFSH